MTDLIDTSGSTAPPAAPKKNKSVRSWFHQLRPAPDADGKTAPGDRATIARLKRASIAEAMAEPAVIELFHVLGYSDKSVDWALPRVAAVATVLVHVKTDKNRIARVVGVPEKGKPEDAKLKPVRLRRLLSARGNEEIATAFRRLVALADGQADVEDLARLLRDWDDETRGDQTRAKFAFDYYNAGQYAPADGCEPDGKVAAHS